MTLEKKSTVNFVTRNMRFVLRNVKLVGTAREHSRTMSHRLRSNVAPRGALIGAAASDRTGIVHLGMGNFHRAHTAVFTAGAMAAAGGERGIRGLASASARGPAPRRRRANTR